MKTKIAITTAIDDQGTTSLLVPYITAIEDAGALPILIPYCLDTTLEALISECDGILFTGGVDVCPERYGETTHEKCGPTSPMRDEIETKVLNLALKKDKPILAICRGIQFLNVMLGGTLYQDVPSMRPSNISHIQTEDKFTPSHSVEILEGTPLFDLVSKNEMIANSFHHQAIKDLAPSLNIMAKSHDGLIEAVYSNTPYIRAYQWHPERIYKIDEDNKKIFEDFVNKSQRRKNA